MTRKIVFGCDHSTTHCYEEIIKMIHEAAADIEVIYVGPTTEGSVDYPDYAAKVCETLLRGDAEKGVLICGTGIGISIAANKFHGIRAAVCHDHLTASLCRQHNDANVVCMGERIVGMEVIRDIITTFLNTDFSEGERHKCRIAKITAIESSQ